MYLTKFAHKNNKPKPQNIELNKLKPIDINKEDLISKFKNKKPSDDSSLNSAAFSENPLTNSQISQQNTNSLKTDKATERYLRKKYEFTLRMQAQRYFTERENIRKQYEERNSYIHLFDNNPEFHRIMQKTEKQIIYLLVHIIFIIIYESIINFYVCKSQLAITMTSFMLAISSFIFCVLILLAVEIKFLNDPNLSRGFRFIVILTFLLYIVTYGFNIASFVTSLSTLKEKCDIFFRIFTYILFTITIILFYPTMQKGFFLFVESVLIFMKKKTEYSVLILNEQNNISNVNNSQTTENNTNANLFTNSNNLELIPNKNTVQNDDLNDQNFKNYNYYSKFHASVTYRDSRMYKRSGRESYL